MKGVVTLLIFGLMLSLTARAGDPVAQMTFRVTDDFGNIVTGAPVTASTFLRWIPGPEFGRDEYDTAKGVTDTNGLVVLKLPSKTGNVRYSVLAEGTYFDNMNKMKIGDTAYYRDMGGSLRFTNRVAGKWQPWNSTVELEIKKVLNPIPMFAKRYGSNLKNHKVPEYGKAIGFDLMKGDWVSPYGKGETADFIFTLNCKLGGITSDNYQIYDATLAMNFSNDGDGIQAVYFHPLKGSAFRLPRFAPEICYAINWIKSAYNHEGDSFHETREDQNYFFRVRTKKDESGKVVSALYGKIHGAIDYSWSRVISFMYYLNPMPNDRNLEFDPRRNLFKNLSSLEEVREP